MAEPAAPAERLHALDSLRAVAMLLGIVLHALCSFIAIPFQWPAHDVLRSPVFDAIVYAIHGFRMVVFFFMAGFFAHLLLERRGPREFAVQRARRIGIPFLAGLVLIIPLVLLIWVWADPVFVARMAERNPPSLWTYPTAHLWFLEVLLFLYALALAIRWACLRWTPGLPPRLDAIYDRLLPTPLKPFAFVPFTVALLWFGPFVPEIDHAGMRLLPGWQTIGYYGLFFAAGWWLHRRLHLLDHLRRWLPLYFGLAVLAFFTVGGTMRAIGGARPTPELKLLALFAAATYSWCMTFALTGLFLKIASAHSAWMRYLSDASYWWYLWHIPPIMVLQVLVAPLEVPALLKIAVIVGGTLAVLWPTYHFYVRYTWMGRLLNGPREQPLPAVQPAPA